MSSDIEIVPVVPFDDGVAAGKETTSGQVRRRTKDVLNTEYLKDGLGSMTRASLTAYVMSRLETEPDYVRYPELEDLYPEHLDFLRGFAKGAACSLEEAAVCDYVSYRQGLEQWYQLYQVHHEAAPCPHETHCSGVVMVGPDGVIGGQSAEDGPSQTKPKDYRFRRPKPYRGFKQKIATAEKLVLRKPRTGYIESWGVTNEMGVGCCSGNSCGTWLDDPIEDVWPIKSVPLLRFARNVEHLAELFRRYTLHNWGRGSTLWSDTGGNAMAVEKSYRRVGIRMLEDSVVWSTEGHFESPEMFRFLRAKRLEYLEKAGKHLGAVDMQYATDCHVRFTHIGELCHQPWGRGYEHIRRVFTDHSPFPRAVCRHGGPDTAPYDLCVTQASGFVDFTHNRAFRREWVPWKKFPCEVPETVTQFPERPYLK